MNQPAMLRQMCRSELTQTDIKAIARTRGFAGETVTSRVLLEHVFLSEQGVRQALASLTETETLGLHLLSHRGEAVGLEFFKRVYAGTVRGGLFDSHTVRFKGLLQKVKANLVRRGILLFSILPQAHYQHESVSERLQYLFPEEFAPFLPPLFPAHHLAAEATRQYRHQVVTGKLGEILQLECAAVGQPDREKETGWGLAEGELLFGGKPFTAEHFRACAVARLEAEFPDPGKHSEFRPLPLLLYAVSHLGDDEWMAPEDLRPLFKMGLPQAKLPEPQAMCEAGFQGGLLEKAEHEGACLYRRHGLEGAAQSTSPKSFLGTDNAQEICIHLESAPLEGLERMRQLSHFKVARGRLWAVPSLRKISQAPAATLQSPLLRWLCEHHPAFRTALETIEQRRGNLIVHEDLLVAKVTDPALRVMLEKQFGAPGQLVALAGGFVAFPVGLQPKVQAWMKKSGYVIKTVSAHDH